MFSLTPAAIANDPATMMKIPDQIPAPLKLAHQFVAAKIMKIPNENVITPMVRIAIPIRYNFSKFKIVTNFHYFELQTVYNRGKILILTRLEKCFIPLPP